MRLSGDYLIPPAPECFQLPRALRDQLLHGRADDLHACIDSLLRLVRQLDAVLLRSGAPPDEGPHQRVVGQFHCNGVARCSWWKKNRAGVPAPGPP